MRQDEMHEKCSTFGEMTHTMIWSEILNRRDHCGDFKSKLIGNIKLGVEKPDKCKKFVPTELDLINVCVLDVTQFVAVNLFYFRKY